MSWDGKTNNPQDIVRFGVDHTHLGLVDGDALEAGQMQLEAFGYDQSLSGFEMWRQPIVPSAIDENLREEILRRLPIWESYAVRCSQHPSKFPTKGEPDKCDDGDMTLFNGLMCASGIEEGCKGVQQAQGSDGRWWRSPRLVNREGEGAKVSFSRDMAAGVMLYLISTRDKEAATKWLRWIKGNRACMLDNPTGVGGDCLRRALVYRYCRDDGRDQRCAMVPGSWELLTAVWNKLGLPLDKEMKGRTTGDLTLEALSALFESEGGSDLHLQGVTALLYQIINRSRTSTKQLTRILIAKQPDNPFYMYLHNGPTNKVARRLLDVCKTQEPETKHQWSWQRNTSEKAWEQNMGWDCMFMANLVLQDIAPCTGVRNIIIRAGSSSSRGKVWKTCSGYSLRFQSDDGNLVLYNQGGRPVWSANTNGKGAKKLIMQTDGNLVMYSSSGDAIWSTNTQGNNGAFLAVQNDGNVVIYPASGKCAGNCPFATSTVGK